MWHPNLYVCRYLTGLNAGPDVGMWNPLSSIQSLYPTTKVWHLASDAKT